MAGSLSREDREARAKVLRAVLLVAEKGMTEADLEASCEGLDDAAVEHAVEGLLTSGLLKRQEARLFPSGAATRFDRLRPL